MKVFLAIFFASLVQSGTYNFACPVDLDLNDRVVGINREGGLKYDSWYIDRVLSSLSEKNESRVIGVHLGSPARASELLSNANAFDRLVVVHSDYHTLRYLQAIARGLESEEGKGRCTSFREFQRADFNAESWISFTLGKNVNLIVLSGDEESEENGDATFFMQALHLKTLKLIWLRSPNSRLMEGARHFSEHGYISCFSRGDETGEQVHLSMLSQDSLPADVLCSVLKHWGAPEEEMNRERLEWVVSNSREAREWVLVDSDTYFIADRLQLNIHEEQLMLFSDKHGPGLLTKHGGSTFFFEMKGGVMAVLVFGETLMALNANMGTLQVNRRLMGIRKAGLRAFVERELKPAMEGAFYDEPMD